MRTDTWQRRGLWLLGLTMVVLSAWLVLVLLTTKSAEEGLSVTFLDVGQGDAIFIETPDGVQVLIDGGPDQSVVRELSTELPLFDRSLDLVVATHPDKDHIGGLTDVLGRYQVGRVLTTENAGDTTTAEAFLRAVKREGSELVYARVGQVWQLGASTTLTIWSPADNPAQLETNTASIVAQLRYGDIEFMLTGDAPLTIEEYLVRTYGAALASEVVKLGHHGSRTSTSDVFLETLKAQYAVVSAGVDNSYGHPHSEVVEKVAAAGATLVSTAEDGAVRFRSDGVRVWREGE